MLKIGARVAIKGGTKYHWGVVVSNNGDITLDTGNTLARVPISTIYTTTKYWRKCSGAVSAQWLAEHEIELTAISKSDIDWLKEFKSVKALSWGEPLMRAIWALSNNLLFNDKLGCPTFQIKPDRKTVGYYQFKGGPAKNDIISVDPKRNHSCKALLMVIVHEMIHQYNFRVDFLEKGTFSPNSMGSHGGVFLDWVEPAMDKMGVPVTVKKHGDFKDVVYDTENVLQTQNKEVYVLLVNVLKTVRRLNFDVKYLAAKFDNEEDALQARSSAQVYFQGGSRIRLLKVNIVPLLDNVQSGKLRGKSTKCLTLVNGSKLWIITPAVFTGLLNLGTSI